ncbi:uncharacterized protein LOC129582784 [Paramacrobiotus metropolitanus]|uniref:uncharacterized protein LOC129582784 n=1 Tax=Paramacrobiotus metropolitanus TaxID=2943436 RepID=UPI002446124E|nr:uncharacterized protein LOC129582784 [Paramacrobiotus metropolitanus]
MKPKATNRDRASRTKLLEKAKAASKAGKGKDSEKPSTSLHKVTKKRGTTGTHTKKASKRKYIAESDEDDIEADPSYPDAEDNEDFKKSKQELYQFNRKPFETFEVFLSDLVMAKPFRFVNKKAREYHRYKSRLTAEFESAKVIAFGASVVDVEPVDPKAYEKARKRLSNRETVPFLEGVKLRPLNRMVGLQILRSLDVKRKKMERNLEDGKKRKGPMIIRVNVIDSPLTNNLDRYGYQIADPELNFDQFPATAVDYVFTAIYMVIAKSDNKEEEDEITEDMVMLHLANTYFKIRRSTIRNEKSPATIDKILTGNFVRMMTDVTWNCFIKTIFELRNSEHLKIVVNFLALFEKRSHNLEQKKKKSRRQDLAESLATETVWPIPYEAFQCLNSLPVQLQLRIMKKLTSYRNALQHFGFFLGVYKSAAASVVPKKNTI